MIKFRAVTKQFGEGPPALVEIDLEVPARKTTALIGPSGCGKSTLLRLIIGLLEPTSGAVEVAGRTVTPAGISNYDGASATSFRTAVYFRTLLRAKISRSWRSIFARPRAKSMRAWRNSASLLASPAKTLTAILSSSLAVSGSASL